MSDEQHAQGQVFRWRFDSVKDMRRALEEYLDFLEGTVTTHYGLRSGGDRDPDVHMNAARRRSEIDACMEELQQASPFLWRLIDVHYRRGANAKPQGWLITAACVGLRRVRCPQGVRCTLPLPGARSDNGVEVPACRAAERLRCHDDRELLLQELNIAVRRLYAISTTRWEH